MLIGAQYVLPPRLVVRGAGREWVLGNFTRPADFAAFGRSRGLELQRHFGTGVVLFRGDPKRWAESCGWGKWFCWGGSWHGAGSTCAVWNRRGRDGYCSQGLARLAA